MTSTRLTALLSGLGLIATWVASTPPPAVTPAAPRARAALQTSRSDAPLPVIEVNTRKLRADAAARGLFARPHRNPFEFSARVAPLSHVGRPAVPAEAPAAAPLLPPPPPFTLSGIAEDVTSSGPVRTAVLAGPRDVFLVREGEVVDGRYKVGKIGVDAIELAPVDGSPAISLVMR